jgi:hypothetical protein
VLDLAGQLEPAKGLVGERSQDRQRYRDGSHRRSVSGRLSALSHTSWHALRVKRYSQPGGMVTVRAPMVRCAMDQYGPRVRSPRSWTPPALRSSATRNRSAGRCKPRPSTPCLQSQIGRYHHLRRYGAALVERAMVLSVVARWIPVGTAVNGTLVARPVRRPGTEWCRWLPP